MCYARHMNKSKLQDLVEDGHTQREISKRTGLSQSTIRYWLKKHNLATAAAAGRNKKHSCLCGETDSSKFYGHRKSLCKTCDNQRVVKKNRNNMSWAREQKGNACQHCGYNEYQSALCFHHLNPNEKDPNATNMSGWSRKRLKREIEKCILLCSNCHIAHHSNELQF